MKQSNRKQLSDLEECKMKLAEVLREYNCKLTDPVHDGSWVLLVDIDTGETINAVR